jgi:hypothetical protein
MWGTENWGEMIWGGLQAVPLMGPIGFLAMATCFLVGGYIMQSRHRSRWLTHLAMTAMLVVPLAAAAAVILPNTFNNGTVADADEVNANFSALVDGINSNIPVRTLITYFGATTVVPAGSFVYEKMRVLGSFTKLASDTDILLTWNSHVFQDGAFANWQLRVDDLPVSSNPGAGAAIITSNIPGSAVNTFALFDGLSTGLHEVSLWVRASDTTTVWDNSGNYHRQVLVEEQLTE